MDTASVLGIANFRWDTGLVATFAQNALKQTPPAAIPSDVRGSAEAWRRLTEKPSGIFLQTPQDLELLARVIYGFRHGVSLAQAQRALGAQLLFTKDIDTGLRSYVTFLESLWRQSDSPCAVETVEYVNRFLRSHQLDAVSHADVLQRVKARIEREFPSEAEELVALADQVSSTEWGRYLLKAQGLNWRTTDSLFDPEGKDQIGPLFGQLPTLLATQERFKIFQMLTKSLLIDFLGDPKKKVRMLSLPCGRMRDLLGLNYSNIDIGRVSLLGVDLDPEAIAGAHQFREKLAAQGVRLPATSFMRRNALNLGLMGEVSIINSNGLTIYLGDEERSQFFENCFAALEPGGALVVSHLTPPNEWNMRGIDVVNLERQRQLFTQIIQPLWQNNFRTIGEIVSELKRAGFVDIEPQRDSQGMFPTFLAWKPE